MKCEDCQESITLYVSNDLPEADAAMVESHIESCDGCRRSFTEMQGMLVSLSELREIDAPTCAHDRVMDAIDASRRPVRTVGPVRIVAVAAAALFVLGATFLYPTPPEASPQQPEALSVQPEPGAQVQIAKSIENDTNETPPLFVKIYTEDPDVVIYWYSD